MMSLLRLKELIAPNKCINRYMVNSMIDYSNIHPEQILREEFNEEYESNIQSIWWQLVDFGSSLIALEKIINFRFDLFVEQRYYHFWALTKKALFESCLLTIWRVLIDNSNSEGLTLNQLKNKIMKNFREKETISEFKENHKLLEIEEDIYELKDKVKNIRNNHIAHFNLEINEKITKKKLYDQKISFKEIKSIEKYIINYFNLLCFGYQRSVYPIEYHPNIEKSPGYDDRIDIEIILDNIVRDSVYLNDERVPVTIFSNLVKNLDNKDIEIINFYREKFELKPV